MKLMVSTKHNVVSNCYLKIWRFKNIYILLTTSIWYFLVIIYNFDIIILSMRKLERVYSTNLWKSKTPSEPEAIVLSKFDENEFIKRFHWWSNFGKNGLLIQFGETARVVENPHWNFQQTRVAGGEPWIDRWRGFLEFHYCGNNHSKLIQPLFYFPTSGSFFEIHLLKFLELISTIIFLN